MTPRATQPERTALAWQRAGLGMLAVAALSAHGALRSREPGLVLASGAVAVLALWVLGGLAPARYRQARGTVRDRHGGTAPAGAGTAAVVLVALAAVAAVIPR